MISSKRLFRSNRKDNEDTRRDTIRSINWTRVGRSAIMKERGMTNNGIKFKKLIAVIPRGEKNGHEKTCAHGRESARGTPAVGRCKDVKKNETGGETKCARERKYVAGDERAYATSRREGISPRRVTHTHTRSNFSVALPSYHGADPQEKRPNLNRIG